MSRRALIVTGLVLVSASAGLLAIGVQVLARDRSAMHDAFARDRMHELTEASQAFSADVAGVGNDLDLAATLLEHAESPEVAARELGAMATTKRGYQAMLARSSTEPTRKPIEVVSDDAPPGTLEHTRVALAEQLETATQTPDRLQVSIQLGNDERWRGTACSRAS